MKKQNIHEDKKKLRMTKSRVAILELFNTFHLPLDAESIKKHLLTKHISTDLATIYRFLNVFIDEGVLRKIELNEGKYRYELSSLPHHHHLVCNTCGLIEDIKINDAHITNSIATKTDFKIDHHHLEFFGTCKSCQ